MHRRLDTHEGQVIGHVNALLVLSTGDQVLEQAVACKSFCGCRVTALVQVVQLHPDAVHQFLSKFPCQPAAVQVLLIIRIHVLVKSSRRNGVPAGFNLQKLLYKPEGLACLMESVSPLLRHIGTILCDLEQFQLSCAVGALLRFFQRQLRIPSGIGHSRVAADDDCLQETGFALVISVCQAQ